MAEFLKPVLFLSVLISLIFSTSAQTCSNYAFTSNRRFVSCSDLPVLNSFLHWNYNPSTGTVDIAYRHTNIDSSRWIAWAINPTATGMVGAQALVAFVRTDGTVNAYTSPIQDYNTQLLPGNLSFEVPTIIGDFRNNEMTIFATLQLLNNRTTVNQVWQEGPLRGGNPGRHDLNPANRNSRRTLDFLSGQTSGGGDSRTKRKNVHGVLNAVAWGVMMPLGAILARYLKVFKSADPTWFYLHIATQSSAYIIGVAGWGTGLKLGSESSVQYNPHRNIGIALFTLATLQVFALLLRPKPDHKYRFYWNIYHHLTGYIVIILGIANIFKGFDILEPEKKWKRIYIGVIVGLGIIAVQLEALTWFIVIKRKRQSEKSHHGANGMNGNGNAYGARSQPVV
ncbi:Cytochrome b561 [Macleaya cordata]|uniref:Cytochrome b561 and DOMON domain-containing protein n=1 Tax=Macleaya cordata TaxID=56857 RepID=A0A200QFW9_MACCD|nr:Cytochrome b561 [Macleaya cordata]